MIPSASFLRMMLITPAMASEPYWAAAPSRSTSMRSMAAVGIRSRSTGTAAVPTRALLLIIAVLWRRLPFTRISTWSPPRPRMLMPRTRKAVPPPLMVGALKDGSRRVSMSLRPFWPLVFNCSPEITSTGAGLSVTVRCWLPRTPVTTTVDRVGSLAATASPPRARSSAALRGKARRSC